MKKIKNLIDKSAYNAIKGNTVTVYECEYDTEYGKMSTVVFRDNGDGTFTYYPIIACVSVLKNKVTAYIDHPMCCEEWQIEQISTVEQAEEALADTYKVLEYYNKIFEVCKNSDN